MPSAAPRVAGLTSPGRRRPARPRGSAAPARAAAAAPRRRWARRPARHSWSEQLVVGRQHGPQPRGLVGGVAVLDPPDLAASRRRSSRPMSTGGRGCGAGLPSTRRRQRRGPVRRAGGPAATDGACSRRGGSPSENQVRASLCAKYQIPGSATRNTVPSAARIGLTSAPRVCARAPPGGNGLRPIRDGRVVDRATRDRDVQRRLRRAAHRPPPAGDPVAPRQGRRLGARALRRRLVQAAELDVAAVRDGRGRPRRGARPSRASPPSGSCSTPKSEDRLRVQIHEVLHDSRPRARRRPGSGQGRRRGAPAEAARRAHPHPRRRLDARPSRVHDARSGRSTSCARTAPAPRVAIEIKRRGDIDGVEQLTRYLELMNRDPHLAPVTGVFAAQQIKPQARTLAEDRGIRCVVARLRRAQGHRQQRAPPLLSDAELGCTPGGCGHERPAVVADLEDHRVGGRPGRAAQVLEDGIQLAGGNRNDDPLAAVQVGQGLRAPRRRRRLAQAAPASDRSEPGRIVRGRADRNERPGSPHSAEPCPARYAPHLRCATVGDIDGIEIPRLAEWRR